ncbi:phenylacetic acid degradation protein [Deinococcus ruber]|uniref:Phenylacetic acid degradation protein n=1 Tax=Deinococcus ruber TaxID=1848197 RepID=A0A918CKH4_9DEIO|nr:phenylacetic acid degradation protein [Deinococcus ruber]GGR29301.1 phenylacetic acid degradation protein [Deinococcus ruber]
MSELPRWEVFKQDGPNKVHQAVGSVHAGDGQHALFTARSVFARRPAAVSLWVARADHIVALTRQELEAGKGLPEGESGTFHVFGKKTNRRSMTLGDHLGTLDASSPQAALEAARTQFGEDLLVWWLVPDSALVRSTDNAETVESWFAPAKDKTYKQQSSYGVVGQHASAHKKAIRGGGHD